MPSTFEWTTAILIPLHFTWLSCHLLKTDGHNNNDDTTDDSSHSNPSHAVVFLLYLVLDASLGHLFHLLLLNPARCLARRLPGAVVPPLPAREAHWTKQEEETNDPSLSWPADEALTHLPRDWIVAKQTTGHDRDSHDGGNAIRRDKRLDTSEAPRSNDRSLPLRPYYLNHVRGSTRLRHAAQRVGAALGTVVASFLVCRFATSWMGLQDIGLHSRQSSWDVFLDFARGFFVGSFLVTMIFILELRWGWVRIIGYWNTVDPNETFLLNFAWDVLFHVAVSINEEVMLRGWMFVLSSRGVALYSAKWFAEDERTAATFAIIIAITLQSTLFAMLHFHSPGSNCVSLLNLFLGGIAASWNFLVSGGTLWLGIGWHFGWNIFMGHVLGRSTSGIPMSCAVFNVVPRPCGNGTSYEKYHGGVFGPEQGVLAPLAYVVGMCMMIYIYGLDGLLDYRERLVLQMAYKG